VLETPPVGLGHVDVDFVVVDGPPALAQVALQPPELGDGVDRGAVRGLDDATRRGRARAL